MFRNQSHVISSPNAAWWQAHQQLPVPSRPLASQVPGWIFLHGARFPKSDHAVRLPGGTTTRIQLVHNQAPPESIHLGIRSGAWPLSLNGHIGSSRFNVDLPPHQQNIVSIPLPAPHQHYPATEQFPATAVHEMNLSCPHGDAWIEVISDPEHLTHYRAFGPSPTSPPELLDEDALAILANTRFLSNGTATSIEPPS